MSSEIRPKARWDEERDLGKTVNGTSAGMANGTSAYGLRRGSVRSGNRTNGLPVISPEFGG
ncbi:hypothetical protein Ntsu_20120 [Nocardia sp. IFM 10818]